MRFRGCISLAVAATALAGCPVDVSVVPEGGGGSHAGAGAPSSGGSDSGGSDSGGGSAEGMPGCAAFVRVGEPLVFTSGGGPQLSTIDSSLVGLYHTLPVDDEVTLVLEHPFEAWPPTTTSPIPRLYAPDPNGWFHARSDGAFVSSGLVLSFWEEGELSEPPSSEGYWDPHLSPDGEGIAWSSNELTMVFPTLSPTAPTTTIAGAFRFATLDAAGRAVFRQQSDDGLTLVRLDAGQLAPMLVTAPAAADEGELRLLAWERGLWAVRYSLEQGHLALGIEGLAETGAPQPARVVELPAPLSLFGRPQSFRGGVLSVYLGDGEADHAVILALTDGEHLTLGEEPIDQACGDWPGVATSPDGSSVLVATTTCAGGFEVRRFDCVE